MVTLLALCVAPGSLAVCARKIIVPDLDEIHLKGRLVRVVYASDVTRKPSVARRCFDSAKRFAVAGHTLPWSISRRA